MHGGQRKGAGSPPKSEAGPMVTVSIKAPPDVVERLRAVEATQAQVLEWGVDVAERKERRKS